MSTKNIKSLPLNFQLFKGLNKSKAERGIVSRGVRDTENFKSWIGDENAMTRSGMCCLLYAGCRIKNSK